MAWLTDEDYRVVIGEDALKLVQQSDANIRDNAEASAIEEVSGYLRSRYDVQKVFSATGNERNKVIVMRTADIALYHMTCSRPGRQGLEIRKERYESAIKWLEQVQAGKVMPELPLMIGPNGEEDILNPIRYGSERKNHYGW